MDWTILTTIITIVGTPAAVFAATWQAWESRKQREAASVQFYQARYDEARPILSIISSPQSIPVLQGSDYHLDWSSQSPVLKVCNVGNGPALNVRSVIYGPEATATSVGGFPAIQTWQYLSNDKKERGKHWYHWTTNVVNQAEQTELQYVLAGSFSPIQFPETNKFIQSKDHKQKLAFNGPKNPLYSPNAGETWYLCRVTITYHDIFHRKHASIHDLAYSKRWEVVALIDDISKDLDDLLK